jgi:hypothetical protein
LKQGLDAKWWGVEKCITIPSTGTYFIGHAADNLMRIYVDGTLLYQFTGINAGNYEIWNLRRITLTEGKHTIRMAAYSYYGAHSVAMELYGSTEAVLKAGTESIIRSQTLLSTGDMLTDGNTLIYHTDNSGEKLSTNLTCRSGILPNMCDGTPNCGYKPKGACPDGYTRSADGQSCVPDGSFENKSEDLMLEKRPAHIAYSSAGAKFYNESGTAYEALSNDFWGMANCSVGSFARVAGTSQSTYLNAAESVTYDTATNTSTRSTIAASSATCGRLNASGIWLKGRFELSWIGVNACLKVPESKTYYIGMGADNEMRVVIDGVKDH